MDLLNNVQSGWRDLMVNKSDPRVASWPLASSPLPTLIICLTYVYAVKVNISHHISLIFFFLFNPLIDDIITIRKN